MNQQLSPTSIRALKAFMAALAIIVAYGVTLFFTDVRTSMLECTRGGTPECRLEIAQGLGPVTERTLALSEIKEVRKGQRGRGSSGNSSSTSNYRIELVTVDEVIPLTGWGGSSLIAERFAAPIRAFLTDPSVPSVRAKFNILFTLGTALWLVALVGIPCGFLFVR